MREVGCKYSIHEETLRKRLKVGLTGGPSTSRKAIFNKTQKSEISTHILILVEVFHGFTLI